MTDYIATLDTIHKRIYEIRGQKVILDRDLASMYGVTTGNLNKAVKRNIGRFPEDFMFRLTNEENEDLEHLIFQTGIPKKRGGSRYNPFVFTEQGVAMLSSVLNNETAIRVNISIMRAFVSARRMLAQPQTKEFSELANRLEKLEAYIEEIIADVNDVNEDTRLQIELINQSLAELTTQNRALNKPRPKVGFKLS